MSLDFLINMRDYYGISKSGSSTSAHHGNGGGAHGVAQNVVNQSPTIINNNSGGGYSNNTGIHKSMHANTPDTMDKMREFEKEDKKESRESSAAWIGGIATIALAAVSAFTLKSLYRDSQALKEAQEYRDNELIKEDPQFQKEMTPILKKHISILEASYSRSRNYAILGAAILVSAVAGFIGGMLSIHWLITAAVVAGVFLTAALVFLVVWHWSDETTLPASMQRKVDVLIDQYC